MSVGPRFAFTLVSSLVAAVFLAGCDVDTPLKEIGDAQHLAADLSVQFSKALDASNLAVMAGLFVVFMAIGTTLFVRAEQNR